MNLSNNIIPEDLFQSLTKDKAIRREVMRGSFNFFFHFYFAHYVEFPTAPFQRNLIGQLENEPTENLFVVAFRGSGKSTIVTTAYPIWAILGQQQKKFVVIFCQTRGQAKQHMMNIRNELENNPLLKSDLGPFDEESDEWGSQSLVFSNTQARITVASTEQSIRGLRHHQHRPDLIICDDVEDVASTKTREGRNKTYQWLTGDVIPAGDRNTRLIIVGNLLHEDSLLMRLRERVVNNEINGSFISCPLLDSNNRCAWVGKFPNQESIDRECKKIGDEIAWQREYLLRIVPNEDQAIHREWIQYYDELPSRNSYREIIVGVDLAISEEESAHYTSMVSAIVCGSGDTFCVYILPNIINRRMTFPQTMDQIRALNTINRNIYSSVCFHVENVGYQKAVIDQLTHEGISVLGVRPITDKHSRLKTTSAIIQNGKIKFPRYGAEELIRQLIGFGVERYDDLADAFSIVGHGAIAKDVPGANIYVLEY